MAQLPPFVYLNKDNFYFQVAGAPVSTATITASTITTDVLNVQTEPGAGVVIGNGGGLGVSEAFFASTNQTLLHSDTVFNNGVVGATFGQGFSANDINYGMAYYTGAGLTQKGSIEFFSSINTTTGGVQIQGQSGEFMVVGAGNASLGNLGANNGITVNSNGIVLNPGANKPVQLQQGYYDVNNLAMSNVSSINGQNVATFGNVPTIEWENTYAGPIIISTLGTSSTPVPIKYLSSVSSVAYKVTVEFIATNGGGGAAQDMTVLGLQNFNTDTNTGVGKIIPMASFNPNLTDNSYYATASAIIPATQSSILVCAYSDTLNNNIEIIDVEAIYSQNLGQLVAP